MSRTVPNSHTLVAIAGPSRPRVNPYLQTCPSRQLLDLLADTWTVLVLHAIGAGIHRHGQLRQRITGISERMLTRTLQRLVRDGLVSREEVGSGPHRAAYVLTPLGGSLRPVVDGLERWVVEHFHDVQRHRQQHAPAATRRGLSKTG